MIKTPFRYRFVTVLYLGSIVAAVLASSLGRAQLRVSNFETEDDPRGEPEVVICNQNLGNFGALRDVQSRDASIDSNQLLNKQVDIVKRFMKHGCDIIAVQEVLGRTPELAHQALKQLTDLLQKKTNRFFISVVGEGEDPLSRVAFLYARDKVSLLNTVIYNNVELPRLSPEDKPEFFARAPLEVQFTTKPGVNPVQKIISLVNIHFKSKRAGRDDPAALEWETTRMVMAEAVRRIAINRHRKSISLGDSIVVILGDRNSSQFSASARILEGTLRLSNFQNDGGCRLSESGFPLCKANSSGPKDFISVLTDDPGTRTQPGTFRYEGKYHWLDDILLPQESLRYAFARYDQPGRYDVGLVTEYPKASDHTMVYVKLNW
jgi:predicted extracellular nuclease